MSDSERQEFEALKAQVAELMEWKRTKESNTFAFTDREVNALRELFRNTIFERINVRDIYFVATQESPTENGQMRFFDDRATQTMRICTTKGVFVGSVDLTAV